MTLIFNVMIHCASISLKRESQLLALLHETQLWLSLGVQSSSSIHRGFLLFRFCSRFLGTRISHLQGNTNSLYAPSNFCRLKKNLGFIHRIFEGMKKLRGAES